MRKSDARLALPTAALLQSRKYQPSQRPLQLPRPPPRLSLEHLHHDILHCASNVKRLMENEHELRRVVRDVLLERLGMEGSHVEPPLRLCTEDNAEVTASPFCAVASASAPLSSSVESTEQLRCTHDAGPRSMRASNVDDDAGSSQPTWFMPWLQHLRMEQEKQLRQMREMLVVVRRSLSPDSSDEDARASSLMRTTEEARDGTRTAEPPHALLWQRHRCLLPPDRPEAVEACSTLLAMQEMLQTQSTQLVRLEKLLQETLIPDTARRTSHGAGALPLPSPSAHQVEAAAAARAHHTVHRSRSNDTVLPTLTYTAASPEKNGRRAVPSCSGYNADVPAAAAAAATSSRVSTCVSAPSPPPVCTPKNVRPAAAFTDGHTHTRSHQQNQPQLDAIQREIDDLCHFLRETLTQQQAQPTPQPHNPLNKTGSDVRVNGQPSASMRETNSQYASAHALQWQPQHEADPYLQEARRRQQHPSRDVSRSHTASGYPPSFSMHTDDSIWRTKRK
ncbi:hypothetical protein, unknown function [Leishmania infantum JPCM5]|uniref:Uncharacterized protein n=3 Tax=Leishmania donovani species complex TaxID=38574 RepID=A4HUI0_LEIIN|nr:hypothetical protein, unknown function [Leishmania infantum JPCM5]AYU76695.1 hypothetical protein LdCL_100014100 [Leishmania donovani]CAC9457895.1 hypothetical_protein_-_conserved [Leishmania infantum]CAM66088.1 hypothetical protein, unknown function [Leishmania infantum JPCM5]SUZ39705.1 hypothetical_protein_-_conserved [Leishmania infantum]VDZ42649.1 hypothetical_protein_conserved [Leishmania donovani]|eukprot:XP_001463721.1 hypothetical protein, unknown function [Leishmania infantum JPCM5]